MKKNTLVSIALRLCVAALPLVAVCPRAAAQEREQVLECLTTLW